MDQTFRNLQIQRYITLKSLNRQTSFGFYFNSTATYSPCLTLYYCISLFTSLFICKGLIHNFLTITFYPTTYLDLNTISGLILAVSLLLVTAFFLGYRFLKRNKFKDYPRILRFTDILQKSKFNFHKHK